ncbi:MAG: DDE superfamily endonuclease [Candidatus Nitrotoga sp. LAW]|nr:MAG: DDE superfamily endonuclease [Candidatus Nitrotoga sp. LAW]
MDGAEQRVEFRSTYRISEAVGERCQRKVFLMLDNLRVHHAKLVKAWLAKQQDEIEVFYLPSYSPELNPDEMLNADLKQAVTTKVPARTKG